MSTQSEIIRQWVVTNRIKQSDICEKTGITKADLCNYLQGRRPFTTQAAKKLMDCYNINPIFLLYGEGEPFLSGGSRIIDNTGAHFHASGNITNSIGTDASKDKVIETLAGANDKLTDTVSRLSRTIESLLHQS